MLRGRANYKQHGLREKCYTTFKIHLCTVFAYTHIYIANWWLQSLKEAIKIDYFFKYKIERVLSSFEKGCHIT